MGDPQPPDAPPCRRNPSATSAHHSGVTGDHHRGRAVHRRDRDPVPAPAVPGHLGLGSGHRDHRPARGQRLHQPRPGRHQLARLRQGQHPGHMRRRQSRRPNGRPPHPGLIPHDASSATRPASTANSPPARTASGPPGPRPPRRGPGPHHRPGPRARPPAAHTPGRRPPRTPGWPHTAPGPSRPAAPLAREQEHRPAACPPARHRPGDHARARLARRQGRQPVRQLLPPPPVTTARCSSTDRAVASDHPTSAGSRPGRAATHSASRPACPASPPAVRPDTTHASAPGPSAGTASPPAAGSGSGSAGASSRMRCALVPLIPNDDTPARRGRSPRGHGTASVSSRTCPGLTSPRAGTARPRAGSAAAPGAAAPSPS